MQLTLRQNQIIDKAISLIAECGIQNFTIKNLACSVGVSEPALYRHFENKFAILHTILECFSAVASEVLSSEMFERKKPMDKIEFFLMDRYRRFAANPQLAKVLFSEEIFQNDQRLAEKVLLIMHSHKEAMHKVIIAGQQTGEIRKDIDSTSMFRIIFGPMRLLIKQWCLSNYGFDLESEGKNLWDNQKKLITEVKN